MTTAWVTDEGLAWATFWVTLVGSIGTVGALVVATYLGVHEVRALRREAREREVTRSEEEERRRRSQAECVSARLVVNPQPMLTTMRTQGTVEHAAYVDVFNASALPIYDVEVHVPHVDHPGMVSVNRSVTIVPGGQSGHAHTPPQSSAQFDGRGVGLMFRDAAGLEWHRHSDGTLHEIADGERPAHQPGAGSAGETEVAMQEE